VGYGPCETIRAQASAADVQGVISAVGRRTITFQTERKGKVCEEVDDRTKGEKGGANVKLGDLQESDLALIDEEPEGTRRRLRSG
jgi:hypothetical protein